MTKEFLIVGDLVIGAAGSDYIAALKKRVIYQVVEVIPPADDETDEIKKYHKYKLRTAFDIESPVGTAIECFTVSSHSLRKLTLLDVATIRLHFDQFIREWAKSQGAIDIDDVR